MGEIELVFLCIGVMGISCALLHAVERAAENIYEKLGDENNGMDD